MVRRITGKGQWQGINQLEINDNKITNINKIVNTLAKTISKQSSSGNYTKIFQEQKARIERKLLNFNPYNRELYNKPFSLREWEDSLHKAHDTGPDNIHCQILKHLPIMSF